MPPPQPAKIKDWQKFKEFVDCHGDKTQKELAQLWGENISHHTISRGFKNSSRIRELIENAGCELLFLPSYSPDLNPNDSYTWFNGSVFPL